jgi:4-hydroxy-tetrahydrodipicolinate synthase
VTPPSSRCCAKTSPDRLHTSHKTPSLEFVGLCDGSGDITRPLRLRGRLPQGFRLLSGHADTEMPFLFYAGDGSISATAGIAPALMREMHLACGQREVIQATELMDRLAPLSDVLAQDPTPASVKYALSLLHLSPPRLRLPMVDLCSTEKIAIAEAMAIALGPCRAASEDCDQQRKRRDRRAHRGVK